MRDDFSKVFDSPTCHFYSPRFVLLVTLGVGVDVKFGVVVSRKVSKKAVVRNRIKRIAREAFRAHCTQLMTDTQYLNAGCHIACIAKKPRNPLVVKAVGTDYHESLARLFTQLFGYVHTQAASH